MNDTRRTRAILGVLLFVSLTMITIDYRGGEHSPLRWFRGFGQAIFGPVEQATASVVRPVALLLDTVADSPGAQRRINGLERENQRLREQVRAERIDKSRAAELDRVLGTAGLGRYRVVPAEVISSGEGLEDTVSIDIGESDGVRPDMTVIDGDGLVGRVTRTGPSTSTVLLATDAASAVGGRLEDSKEIGIVQGAGRRSGSAITFQLLDSRAPLKPGQRIVSFGSQGDRPYVPGVPIGTVTTIKRTPGSLTRTANVRPFVHFTSLDVVGVVVEGPKHDPRDAVLPPRPSGPPPVPKPTPTPPVSPPPATSTPEATSSPHASPRPSSGG